MALKSIYDYFHHYDKNTYQVVACKGNEPSIEDLVAYEAHVGMKLPKEYQEFTLSSLGGLYMEVLENIWPQATLYQVGPFWSFCRGLLVYGIAKNIPDFLDLRVKTQELIDLELTGYIPFMKIVGNGDELFCFNEQGEIVLLDVYEGSYEKIEGTFSECFMRQIDELETRKNRILKGEHH